MLLLEALPQCSVPSVVLHQSPSHNATTIMNNPDKLHVTERKAHSSSKPRALCAFSFFFFVHQSFCVPLLLAAARTTREYLAYKARFLYRIFFRSVRRDREIFLLKQINSKVLCWEMVFFSGIWDEALCWEVVDIQTHQLLRILDPPTPVPVSQLIILYVCITEMI